MDFNEIATHLHARMASILSLRKLRWADFCRAYNHSQSSISKIISANRLFSTEILLEFAEFTDTTIQYLLHGKGKDKLELDKHSTEAVSIISNLNEKNKSEGVAFLKGLQVGQNQAETFKQTLM